jgi:hypothetical protein
MAENIKISELDSLTAAQNSTVVPVVDGGTTKKMSLSTLQTHLTASFASPSDLSSEISTVNSTISGLDTDDISEGSNKYYTDARVKTKMDTEGVLSGSAAAIRTFLNVEDGAGVVDDNSVVNALISATGISSGDKTTIQTNLGVSAGGVDLGGTGTISSSAQISDFNTFVENSITSSMSVLSASYALTASYALNAGGGGGGGSTDYISNVTFGGTTLSFTGSGNAFNTTVDLSGGEIITLGDSDTIFVDYNTYLLESESFATRIDNAGGGGGGGDVTIPDGTVSSSAQTIQHINTVGVISSSAQVDGTQLDLSGLTADDIQDGSVNRYYANTLVKPYLDQLQVVSGSVPGFNVSGTNIISSSQQISNLTFVLQTALDASASTLQANIDGIQGVNLG